jgi:Interferon-induced transmembrane protein
MSEQWTPPPSPTAAPANIPNYLIPAILSLFCCWPLSIVAIIFAAQVNGKVAAGDIQGALDASKKAKLFSFIAIGIGLVLILIYIVITILGVSIGALQSR